MEESDLGNRNECVIDDSIGATGDNQSFTRNDTSKKADVVSASDMKHKADIYKKVSCEVQPVAAQ